MNLKTKFKLKMKLKWMLLILGIIIIGISGIGCWKEFKSPINTKEIITKRLVKKKAKELFVGEITISDLKLPFFSDFLERCKIYMVRGDFKDFIYPGSKVIAVNQNGNTFVLPDEFNQLIKEEKIRIADGATALNLAKGYILTHQDKEMGEIIIILNQANDIPWERKPSYGKDPKKYIDLIKPPQISSKNQTYYITLYTWHRIQGVIYRWSFEIKSNGLLFVKEETALASYVGDCRLPFY
jgi:hypothetical protein